MIKFIEITMKLRIIKKMHETFPNFLPSCFSSIEATLIMVQMHIVCLCAFEKTSNYNHVYNTTFFVKKNQLGNNLLNDRLETS